MLIDTKTHRRRFLKQSFGSVAALSLAGHQMPGLWQRAAAAEHASSDNILVVIQLSGGNDGLNTVIPYRDDEYRKHRPTLAMATDQVVPLDDDLGLHPALSGFAQMMDEGRATIVQGVGYPNPNRSHFESMDIWHTCQRKQESSRDQGWLGAVLEQQKVDSLDHAAIHLGSEKLPLALASADVRVPSITDLERFALSGNGEINLRDAVAQLNDGRTADSQPASPDELLGFLRSSTTAALRASERIQQAQKDYSSAAAYPNSELAKKLKTVAQLIDSDLATRVYYLTLDGFDTHARQADQHNLLLRQLGDGLSSFVLDLHEQGHLSRITVMAFSEFGRRVAENASLGTDHGAAGPVILAGGKLRSPWAGVHPSLTDLQDGDLRHAIDFRQVYAALITDWMNADADQVLGAHFEPLELFAT